MTCTDLQWPPKLIFYWFLLNLYGFCEGSINSSLYKLLFSLLTLFYMGGCDTPPLGGLSFAAHRWVPQTGWFFMSLFLAILELSWTGHFWIFFWKFQKFSRRQIFPKSIQRGDPSIQKSKKSKKAFFLLQIIFFLPKY